MSKDVNFHWLFPKWKSIVSSLKFPIYFRSDDGETKCYWRHVILDCILFVLDCWISANRKARNGIRPLMKYNSANYLLEREIIFTQLLDTYMRGNIYYAFCCNLIRRGRETSYSVRPVVLPRQPNIEMMNCFIITHSSWINGFFFKRKTKTRVALGFTFWYWIFGHYTEVWGGILFANYLIK